MVNFECKMLISGKNLIIVRIRIFINCLNIIFILVILCCWVLIYYNFFNFFNDDSMFRL